MNRGMLLELAALCQFSFLTSNPVIFVLVLFIPLAIQKTVLIPYAPEDAGAYFLFLSEISYFNFQFSSKRKMFSFFLQGINCCFLQAKLINLHQNVFRYETRLGCLLFGKIYGVVGQQSCYNHISSSFFFLLSM